MGNGPFGAMVFGQPENERLQLNDVTVWSGDPNPNADRQDAYKSLPQLREPMRTGKYDEASRFANANFNGPAPYTSSYQTLGDLRFGFRLPAGGVTDFHSATKVLGPSSSARNLGLACLYTCGST